MMLGIARGDVAGDTLGKPESPEDTKRPGELLLAAESFLLDGVPGALGDAGRPGSVTVISISSSPVRTRVTLLGSVP